MRGQSSCQQVLLWSMHVSNRGLQLCVRTALPRSDWLVAGLEMSTESQLKCERMDCFLTAARRFSHYPQCGLFKQQRGKEETWIACDQCCLVPCRVTLISGFQAGAFRTHWAKALWWATLPALSLLHIKPGVSLGLWSSHLPVLHVPIGKIKCPDQCLVPSGLENHPDHQGAYTSSTWGILKGFWMMRVDTDANSEGRLKHLGWPSWNLAAVTIPKTTKGY